MGAALRRSGSFPQRHLETAPQETPSSTPPGRPACLLPARHHLGVLRKPPFLPHLSSVYCPIIPFSPFLGLNSRYRRALSNNCTEGAPLRFSPRRQKCPSRAPRGLQLLTSEGTLVATLGRNVTFLVFLEEVLTSVPHTEQHCFLAACLFNQSLRDIVDFFPPFFVIKVLRVVEQQVQLWAGPARLRFLFTPLNKFQEPVQVFIMIKRNTHRR